MSTPVVKRSMSVKIRLTPEEHEQLQRKKNCPQLASWMRDRCLSGANVPPPPVADPALLRQVAGIGNNLNQVARRINSGEWGPADKVQILVMLKMIDESLGVLLDKQNTQQG